MFPATVEIDAQQSASGMLRLAFDILRDVLPIPNVQSRCSADRSQCRYGLSGRNGSLHTAITKAKLLHGPRRICPKRFFTMIEISLHKHRLKHSNSNRITHLKWSPTHQPSAILPNYHSPEFAYKKITPSLLSCIQPCS